MRTLTATLTAALLIAACTGVPPANTAGPTPADGPTPTVALTEGPTATPAPDLTAPPVAPTAPPPGGPVGPVYSGDLAGALPRVVAGHEMEITIASAEDLAELSQATVDLLEVLGVPRSNAEIGIAHSDSAGVLIVAVRLPGVDSATIDGTFFDLQSAETSTQNFRVESVAGRNVHVWDSIVGTNWAWVNGDILFWMFGDEPDAHQAIAMMPLPTVALQPGGVGTSGRAEVELTVVGGPGAGQYSGSVTESGGCSRNAMRTGAFGFVSYDEQSMGQLLSANMLIRDGAAAMAGGTDDFVLDVEVDDGTELVELSLSPAGGRGSGSANVSDAGQTATFTISGTTSDGVDLELTVNCNTVLDLGG